MEKDVLIEEALRLCGLTSNEFWQLYHTENPTVQTESVSHQEIWRFLADYYQRMLIASNQIAMVTDIYGQDVEDIMMDEQALAFPTGSALRIHVMSLLNAISVRELGLDVPIRLTSRKKLPD